MADPLQPPRPGPTPFPGRVAAHRGKEHDPTTQVDDRPWRHLVRCKPPGNLAGRTRAAQPQHVHAPPVTAATFHGPSPCHHRRI